SASWSICICLASRSDRCRWRPGRSPSIPARPTSASSSIPKSWRSSSAPGVSPSTFPATSPDLNSHSGPSGTEPHDQGEGLQPGRPHGQPQSQRRAAGTFTADRLPRRAAAPKMERREQRMVYAARRHDAGNFNPSLNPLISLAATLLSEVVRLKNTYQAEDLHSLKERLSSEIRLFEHQALQDSGDSSEV